ncbi:MAG: TIM barrel protein [Bryocella sp.]
MKKLLVGNAPCSWGSLEFEESKGFEQIGYSQMLDELVETGYTGTELGDWGYMPTDPSVLRAELVRRGVTMLGAFVPVDLKDVGAHDAGVAATVKIATLLAAVAQTPAPFLVLADANGTNAERTRTAGRVTPDSGLSPEEWETFAAGANRIGRAVLEQTGLRTVFHHHCAGFVETPDEIATFLSKTDPRHIGLVFDTGHFTYGAGESGADMSAFLDRFADRICYVHCKDCSGEIASQARSKQWDYFEALRHGVFCELGKGVVDFPLLLRWMKAKNYTGYVVVEQDVLPGLGSPKLSAQRNRDYLRSIESQYA